MVAVRYLFGMKNHTVNGWHVIFGVPEEYGKIKEIDNHILNQRVKDFVTNKNDAELTVRSNEGLIKVEFDNRDLKIDTGTPIYHICCMV